MIFLKLRMEKRRYKWDKMFKLEGLVCQNTGGGMFGFYLLLLWGVRKEWLV